MTVERGGLEYFIRVDPQGLEGLDKFVKDVSSLKQALSSVPRAARGLRTVSREGSAVARQAGGIKSFRDEISKLKREIEDLQSAKVPRANRLTALQQQLTRAAEREAKIQATINREKAQGIRISDRANVDLLKSTRDRLKLEKRVTDERRAQAREANRLKNQTDPRRIAAAQRSQARTRAAADALLFRDREFRKIRRNQELFNRGLGEGARQAGFLGNSLKGVFRIVVIFEAARAAVTAFNTSVREGVRFAAELEQSILGIAAVISAVGDIEGGFGGEVTAVDRLTFALGEAESQVGQLRLEALRTAATFEELTFAFQTALGPGLRAGLDIDQVRQFSIAISQAATAIGLEQRQLAEEVRSILAGTIRPQNTRIATVLGISNDDIERAREAGELFELLQDRFEAFGVAAERSLRNFNVLLTNAGDALRALGAEALEPLVDELKLLFEEVIETVTGAELGDSAFISPQTLEATRAFGEALAEIVSVARSLIQRIDAADIQTLGEAFRAAADFAASLAEESLVAVIDALVLVSKVLTPVIKGLDFLVESAPGVFRLGVQLLLLAKAVQLLKASFLGLEVSAVGFLSRTKAGTRVLQGLSTALGTLLPKLAAFAKSLLTLKGAAIGGSIASVGLTLQGIVETFFDLPGAIQGVENVLRSNFLDPGQPIAYTENLDRLVERLKQIPVSLRQSSFDAQKFDEALNALSERGDDLRQDLRAFAISEDLPSQFWQIAEVAERVSLSFEDASGKGLSAIVKDLSATRKSLELSESGVDALSEGIARSVDEFGKSARAGDAVVTVIRGLLVALSNAGRASTRLRTELEGVSKLRDRASKQLEQLRGQEQTDETASQILEAREELLDLASRESVLKVRVQASEESLESLKGQLRIVQEDAAGFAGIFNPNDPESRKQEEFLNQLGIQVQQLATYELGVLEAQSKLNTALGREKEAREAISRVVQLQASRDMQVLLRSEQDRADAARDQLEIEREKTRLLERQGESGSAAGGQFLPRLKEANLEVAKVEEDRRDTLKAISTIQREFNKNLAGAPLQALSAGLRVVKGVVQERGDLEKAIAQELVKQLNLQIAQFGAAQELLKARQRIEETSIVRRSSNVIARAQAELQFAQARRGIEEGISTERERQAALARQSALEITARAELDRIELAGELLSIEQSIRSEKAAVGPDVDRINALELERLRIGEEILNVDKLEVLALREIEDVLARMNEDSTFGGFTDGIAQGLLDGIDTWREAGIRAGQDIANSIRSFTSKAVRDAFDPTYNFDLEEALGQLANEIGQTLANSLIEQFITGPLLEGLSGLLGGQEEEDPTQGTLEILNAASASLSSAQTGLDVSATKLGTAANQWQPVILGLNKNISGFLTASKQWNLTAENIRQAAIALQTANASSGGAGDFAAKGGMIGLAGGGPSFPGGKAESLGPKLPTAPKTLDPRDKIQTFLRAGEYVLTPPMLRRLAKQGLGYYELERMRKGQQKQAWGFRDLTLKRNTLKGMAEGGAVTSSVAFTQPGRAAADQGNGQGGGLTVLPVLITDQAGVDQIFRNNLDAQIDLVANNQSEFRQALGIQ